MIPILTPLTVWVCPNCTTEYATHEDLPNRFHACPGLRGGLTAPMVRSGTRCKIEARERDDYVGRELVQRAPDGRPVMSVVTEYADGRSDALVFAPTAYGGVIPQRPHPRMKRLLYRGMN